MQFWQISCISEPDPSANKESQEGGQMRIFIHNDGVSADRLVRRALYLLFKAGVYSAEAGGSIRAPAAVQIDAAHLPEAIAALSKAGIRTAID